jgi:hypothetical protein
VKTRDGWRIRQRTFVPSKLGAREVYDVARPQAAAADKENARPPAQAKDATTTQLTPAVLTALDYFQIQQLVAKYAQYIDTCSNNGNDNAD